jgi:hypothetical protein
MIPAIDSIDVAAIADPVESREQERHPDRDAHGEDGSAVAFIDTPMPAMMLVAWPVVDAARRAARGCIPLPCILGDDDHRRGQREATRPAPHRRSVVSSGLAADTPPIHRCGDEPEADCRDHAGDDQAAIERVHDLAARAALTKKQPTIDARIDQPPSASG